MARWFIIAGAILIILGTLLHYAPSTLSWFGKLPGDINTDNENGKIFIPITSMIIISIVLTVLVNLFKRW